MKVTIERSVLLKALGHVHRIVERRNTIPILANVLIEAGDGRLSLKSTDLDLEASESVPADVAQNGATTVPAHVIYDIVRKLPEGAQASLETAGDAGQLILRSGRSRFALQALPASDFPDLTSGEFSHRFALPGGRAQAPDREHPVRDLDRGDAVLSQRHIPPHRGRRRDGDAARGRDRRPSPGAGRDAGAARLGRHARGHRPAQGGERSAEASRGHDPGRGDRDFDRQGALSVRRRRADDQADRRHVPRLRARHSDRQRQAPRRRQGAVREGGRSRIDALVRARAGRSSSRSPRAR